MIDRREFLQRMLGLVATTAITKGGILIPNEEIVTPERTIFDMAANTWRDRYKTGVWWSISGKTESGAEWSISSTADNPAVREWMKTMPTAWTGTIQVLSDTYELVKKTNVFDFCYVTSHKRGCET